MTHLIDKDALVAEITKRKKRNVLNEGAFEEDIDILSFINSIEAKEVDLEKEIELVKGDYEQVDVAWNNDFDFIAKHFFELGMQQSKKDNNNEEKA